MGEYEPNDSRNVTLNPHRAPGEPPRTGPREGETRRRPSGRKAGELYEDGRGDEPEDTPPEMGAADAGAEAALREQAMEQDAAELDLAEEPGRFDRND